MSNHPIRERIKQVFQESVKVKQDSLKVNLEASVRAVDLIVSCLRAGGKLILFGNGGSAADSQHIAAEFVGRFQKERKALPAIALTTDASCLTALGNDYDFDVIFSRQVEAIGKKGDIALGISTSGNSANVIAGIKAAKKIGLSTISLTGNDGGKLAGLTDIKIVVPSKVTARIQETHICTLHCICELVEESLI